MTPAKTNLNPRLPQAAAADLRLDFDQSKLTEG